MKKEGCEDKRKECRKWAKNGQCDTNPGWMIVFCPVACKACHLLDTKKRCRRQEDQVPVLQPGNSFENFHNKIYLRMTNLLTVRSYRYHGKTFCDPH